MAASPHGNFNSISGTIIGGQSIVVVSYWKTESVVAPTAAHGISNTIFVLALPYILTSRLETEISND